MSVEGMQTAALHITAGGLAVTSLAGVIGVVSPVVGILAGLAAMVAYSLEIYEWFEKRRNKDSSSDNKSS